MLVMWQMFNLVAAINCNTKNTPCNMQKLLPEESIHIPFMQTKWIWEVKQPV